MSDCPSCGKPATHTGVFVGWLDGEVMVAHACYNKWCDSYDAREASGVFYEPAVDEVSGVKS